MGFFTNNNVRNISIGENVRYVNNSMSYLFNGCNKFNSPVTIPNGVTNLDFTFANCSVFGQEVSIPSSVTSMRRTFYNCKMFNNHIVIPEGITSMYGTFSLCSAFNKPITIPNSVTNMYETFYIASNFNQPIVIPNNVNDMYRCLYGTNFNHPITIPESVTNMQSAFHSCKMFNQPITIPNNVNDITYAFSSCNNMTQNITILSPNIGSTKISSFVSYKNNSKRINIIVPKDSITNTSFANNSSYYSIVGNNIKWTTDNTNNRRYNTKYNVYVYWV